MTNRIITPTKLAKRWGVTPRTIHRMIKAGDLPDRKVVHKKEIWFESDIEEFEQNPETKEGMELVK